MINVPSSKATRWGANAIILLGILVALFVGREIFIPMVIALLLAAMLWPFANGMHQSGIPFPGLRRKEGSRMPSFAWKWLHLPWSVACITVITGMVIIIVALLAAFGLGVSKFVVDAASPQKKAEVYMTFREKLARISPTRLDPEYFPDEPKGPVYNTFNEFLDPKSQTFKALALQMGAYGGALVWQSILIVFILLFLLLEGRMLSRRVVEIFGPSTAIQGQVVGALKDMAMQVRAYMVWRTIINFGMAVFLGIVYQIAGLKLAWTWTLLTAILWYIPYLGPIVAGVPPVLDAFISCESPWVTVFIVVFYTIFVVIEGYVVVPVVMGRSMEMNATTVMLACLLWERIWGPVGLFLAMPLMAAVKAICAHVPEWRGWANLMSSEGEEEPPPDGSFHVTENGKEETEAEDPDPDVAEPSGS